MLKSLFNGSVILAVAGFALIFSSSSEVTKTIFTKFFDEVTTYSSKHEASLYPSNIVPAKSIVAQTHPYHLSFVSMNDYYNLVPTYGTLVK